MKKPKNKWRDDIILACKGWYGSSNEVSTLEILRAVQSFHCMIELRYITDQDVANCLIKETFDLLFQNPRQDAAKILFEVFDNANEKRWWMDIVDNRPYWARVVGSVASQVQNVQVRDADTIFVDVPKADPVLKLFILNEFGAKML